MNKKIICAFSLLLFTHTYPAAIPGTLDTTFGINGIALGPIVSLNSTALAIVVQNDGKIITAGVDDVDFVFTLERFNTDGSLDTSFGINGVAKGPVINHNASQANAVTLQNDGKIIAAGYSSNGTHNVFTVLRFNIDGSLDTSFGTNGIAQGPTINGNDSQANGVILQNDGKIITAGYAFNGTHNVFTVVRFNTDGSIDTSFGTNGIAQGPTINDNDSQANGVGLQSDGKIITAGIANDTTNTYNVFTVLRFNTDGSRDTSFGVNGIAQGPIINNNGSQANAMVIQPDDRIVAAGGAINNGRFVFITERFNSNGSLDTTFNPTGPQPGASFTPVINNNNSFAASVTLQNDGKIAAAGQANTSDNVFGVARFNSNGTLDSTFNPTGTVPGFFIGPVINNHNSQASAIAMQKNGMIVAAGHARVFAVMRFNGVNTTDPFALALINKYSSRL